MKELTQEEKAKAYDEALEQAKKELNTCGSIDCDAARQIFRFFPELKESEDERIWTINYLNNRKLNSSIIEEKESLKKAIAWLEKQGERKQHFELKAGHWYICHSAYCCRADHLTVKEGERFMCEKDGVVKGFVIKEPEKYFKEVCAPVPFEDEQKPNKVEPKFKVGDWVVYNRNDSSREIIQVYDIRDGRYYFTDNVHFSWSIKECDEKAHLWTIQDAKDGDVLAISWHEDVDFWEKIIIFKKYHNKGVKGLYSTPCVEGYGNTFKNGKLAFHEEIPYFSKTWTANLHPATKEQHDLLFQRMEEVGYEWDADKKELKKIEQNPAWSEEDEPQKELAETYLAVFDKKFPILPTLKGKKLADYKNFLNKCQQILGLKYWSIRPLQAKLFEKLSLLWAAWGAEHLKGLGQTNEDTDNKNHAWSEEDETMLKRVIDFIPQCMTAHGYNEYINWLKSLKERYTWKPSDEQMKALEYYIEKGFIDKEGIFGRHIIELYAQLKKLK